MTSDLSPEAGDALVIGYGSTLRGDDSVGQMAAEAVARWGRPGVTAVATHLLTPELAEALSRARLAVFVDARVVELDRGVLVEPIGPGEGTRPIYHSAEPRQLLLIARDVFGVCPPAWMVTIPAYETEIGESLTPAAQAGLEAALTELGRLLDGGG